MANRSTFPTTIDQFTELSEVIASDAANIARYQQLLMQATRTTDEETELNNLKTTLAKKIVSSEHINKLQDCIYSLEDYFLNSVMTDIAKTDVGVIRNDVGYPSNLVTNDKTTIVNAINEVKQLVDYNETQNELNLSEHVADNNNPHNVTSSQVNIFTGNLDANADGSNYPLGISVTNIGTSATNYPLSQGTLVSVRANPLRLFQIFFDTGGDANHKSQPYYRFWYSGVGWTSWFQFETTDGSQAKLNAAVQHNQGTKKMMLQTASTPTLNVNNGSYTGYDVVFGTAFAETPVIAGAMTSGSSVLNNVTWKYENVTTTGCKVWVYNNSGNSQIYAIVSLLVYGTKSL